MGEMYIMNKNSDIIFFTYFSLYQRSDKFYNNLWVGIVKFQEPFSKIKYALSVPSLYFALFQFRKLITTVFGELAFLLPSILYAFSQAIGYNLFRFQQIFLTYKSLRNAHFYQLVKFSKI